MTNASAARGIQACPSSLKADVAAAFELSHRLIEELATMLRAIRACADGGNAGDAATLASIGVRAASEAQDLMSELCVNIGVPAESDDA